MIWIFCANMSVGVNFSVSIYWSNTIGILMYENGSGPWLRPDRERNSWPISVSISGRGWVHAQ